MAQLLAPYHNGMRLGQGFNSYTQQIALDNAVLPDTPDNRERVKPYYVPDKQHPEINLLKLKEDESHESSRQLTESSSSLDDERAKQQLPPWVKPQIVTYSSRFVDKLSDITATVGGKGSGSYVDSDKFKESDLNFHLQVKVVNQIHKAEPYTLFNKIHNMEKSDFTAVYGDSFISGWEEGGELNAIVSVKVTDKAKIFEIKADLEAKVKAGALDVEGKFHFDKTKDSISKSTETTIAVNWSGGGSIKDPAEAWTIESMTKAAAAFPDLVAMTPQRTYAILTKYTALESFQRQIENYTILDYENASIYTGMLLDRYMDYKVMWKRLNQAIMELERGTAKITMCEMTEDLNQFAVIMPLPDEQLSAKLRREHVPPATPPDPLTITTKKLGEVLAADSDESFSKTLPKTEKSIAMQLVGGAKEEKYKEGSAEVSRLRFPPFKANFAGLINAKKVCRMEMAKIVNEVDLVTKAPKLALDTKRDAYFLDPLVFRHLLPIVRTWTDDMLLDGSQVTAPVILGYSEPPDRGKPLPNVAIVDNESLKNSRDMKISMQKVRRKAQDYRMQGLVGQGTKDTSLPTGTTMFNDLEMLDPTYRITRFSVWTDNKIVKGVQIQWANGEKKSYGTCDEGVACNSIALNSNGAEVIFEIQIATATSTPATPDNNNAISSIKVVTSFYQQLDSTADQKVILDSTAKSTAPATTETPLTFTARGKPVTWSRPDEGPWSMRGLFGFQKDKSILSLGVVWGKDKFVPRPEANVTLPICKTFFGLDKTHRNKVRDFFNDHPDYPGTFLMGYPLYAGDDPEKYDTYFSDFNWLKPESKLKSIGFCSLNGRLSGLKVTWSDGNWTNRGQTDGNPEVWNSEVKKDLVCARMSKVKVDNAPDRIQTVEFIQSESNGNMPSWLLDVSTLRYLGDGKTNLTIQQPVIVESAPTFDGAKWSVRGFYGTVEKTTPSINGLGLIWGRDP